MCFLRPKESMQAVGACWPECYQQPNPHYPTGACIMNVVVNTSAGKKTILAVDLGKYKSVACIHDQDGGEIRFSTIDTGWAEMRRLIEKENAGVVIIEVCENRCFYLSKAESRFTRP